MTCEMIFSPVNRRSGLWIARGCTTGVRLTGAEAANQLARFCVIGSLGDGGPVAAALETGGASLAPISAFCRRISSRSRVDLEGGERRYFLTWGRISEAVDEEPLERLLMAAAMRCSAGAKPFSAYLCATLQEAAQEPYFFESFFKMCQRPIPYGSGYKE